MVVLTKQPNFFSAAEFIGNLGRIMLRRVRNTDPRSRPDHWCQMAEFRAAGPKNGPVKFLAA
jgi:hypothetical protein